MTDKAVITDIAFFTGITSPYYASNCDQVTDWSGGPTLDSVNFIQGGGALSAKVGKAVYESVFTLKTPEDLKTVRKVIYVWAMCSGRMDTHPGENGYGVGSGFRIRVYQGANWGEWDIAGRNTWAGGWACWAVHTATAFSRNSGTEPDLQYVSKVGVVFETVGAATAPNCWWDALRFGTYIGVKGGTSGSPVDFDYLLAQDDLVANRWGAAYRFEGIVFIQSKLRLGSTTLNDETYFKELSEITLLPDRPFPADFYEVIAEGNSGAITSVVIGDALGGGISGCLVKPAGPTYKFRASNQYLTALGIYGSTLFGADLVELPTYSAAREVLGSSFESYKDITLNTCSVERCNFISGTGLITASGGIIKNCNIVASTAPVALLWNVAFDTLNRLDGTKFVSGGAGHAIEFGTSTPSEISLLNIGFTNYGADETPNAAIYNNSGKHLVINVSGGDTPTVRNGAGASTKIETDVVNYSFSVINETGDPVIGYEWRMYESDPTLGYYGEEIPGTGEEEATESEQTYVYSYSEDIDIVLQILHGDYVEYVLDDTLKSTDKEVKVILRREVNV